MADYIIQNDFKTMEDIWDGLLKLHWDYLESESFSMEKLKMRRKLEGDTCPSHKTLNLHNANLFFCP